LRTGLTRMFWLGRAAFRWSGKWLAHSRESMSIESEPSYPVEREQRKKWSMGFKIEMLMRGQSLIKDSVQCENLGRDWKYDPLRGEVREWRPWYRGSAPVRKRRRELHVWFASVDAMVGTPLYHRDATGRWSQTRRLRAMRSADGAISEQQLDARKI